MEEERVQTAKREVNRKRKESFHVRLTPEEKADAEKMIEKTGLTQRQFFTDAIKKMKIITIDETTGIEMLASLTRSEKNLTAICEGLGAEDGEIKKEAEKALKEAKKTYDKILKVLEEGTA